MHYMCSNSKLQVPAPKSRINKHCNDNIKYHWEIKGRFCKRVVLANVPSFRFSFRGNIRRNHPFGNRPFVNTKKGHWEIKGRFPKGWFGERTLVPVFVPGEHPPKPPFWKPPFCELPKVQMFLEFAWIDFMLGE